MGTYGSEWLSLGAKLYSGRPADAIVQKVPKVAPTILDQGECEDPNGNHKEALALRNPDRVCFSVELLAKRGDILSTNAWKILVGLAAHEYVPLLQKTEDKIKDEAEADFVQSKLALRYFSERGAKIVWEYGEITSEFTTIPSNCAQTSPP